MGKWSNIRGKFSEGEFHRGEGEFWVKNENLKNDVAKISVYTKFHPYRTMGKWTNIHGIFSGWEFGGRILKIKTYKFPSKNEYLQNGVAK